MHYGDSVHFPELEDQVFEWISEQRKRGFAVSTASIILKTLHIHSNFKDQNLSKLRGWVRSFIRGKNLVFLCPTRVSQHTPEAAEQICQKFGQSAMTLMLVDGISNNAFQHARDTYLFLFAE